MNSVFVLIIVAQKYGGGEILRPPACWNSLQAEQKKEKSISWKLPCTSGALRALRLASRADFLLLECSITTRVRYDSGYDCRVGFLSFVRNEGKGKQCTSVLCQFFKERGVVWVPAVILFWLLWVIPDFVRWIHNCKNKSVTAISLAQLLFHQHNYKILCRNYRDKWQNCKCNVTTSIQMSQLQFKWHNCKNKITKKVSCFLLAHTKKATCRRPCPPPSHFLLLLFSIAFNPTPILPKMNPLESWD